MVTWVKLPRFGSGATSVQQLCNCWLEGPPELPAAAREVTRELGWRGRVHTELAELDRPGWARELGEPPRSLRGRRGWRQALATGRHDATPGRPSSASTPSSVPSEQRLDRHGRAHPEQPLTRPTRADRARSAGTDEHERRGRAMPAERPVRLCSTILKAGLWCRPAARGEIVECPHDLSARHEFSIVDRAAASASVRPTRRGS
jgi:hypothetical protein